MKNILAIIGSASNNSANKHLVEYFAVETASLFQVTIFNELKSLPHFDPEVSSNGAPSSILVSRDKINEADGVLISSPEYIFSIPSALKNLLEWCVTTTVFSGKPTAILTASANGTKAHEELQLIMKTLMAKLSTHTTLLIPGIKSKITQTAEMSDLRLAKDIQQLIQAFEKLMQSAS